jgi:hypothetical protein
MSASNLNKMLDEIKKFIKSLPTSTDEEDALINQNFKENLMSQFKGLLEPVQNL